MQLRAALQSGLKTLLEHQVPSAQLAAELLLLHLVKRDRAYLLTNPEIDLSREVTEPYFRLIAERCTGKPTQYLTGHQEFWGLDFEVTPDVLIPRPETEHVVETVLDLARREGAAKDAKLHVVDVGTGSGCIALALASELPRAVLFGADLSGAALVVASRNAVRLGMSDRVKFLQSDLLERFRDGDFSFDFVVSNPPYVARDELDRVQREVREFEPRLAWGGLEHGDEIYRRLFPQALEVLKPGGHVVVEIGYSMRDAVVAHLKSDAASASSPAQCSADQQAAATPAGLWTEVDVRPDLCGIPRVVSARKGG